MVLSIYAVLFSFGAMLLKVPLIKILTSLFSVQKHSDVHYFTYLRLSLIIAFIAFIGSVLLFLSPDHSAEIAWEVYRYSLLVFLFIRLILMYLVLNNSFSFNKFHLISYLCSSEIIPLIILVKTLLR
ncbi:DUF4271 domain-containing protein [Reichenbachiella agarivorans]|uniref:DUF4271 domain-containing protein n=1 Tax=Reichenbachiella agarivorans TaxID=2979464 RepID=UPI00389AE000